MKSRKNIRSLIIIGVVFASFGARAADIGQVKIGPAAIEAIRKSQTPTLLDAATAARLGLDISAARSVVKDMTGNDAVGDITINFHEETQMVDLSSITGASVLIPLSMACPECNGQGGGGQ